MKYGNELKAEIEAKQQRVLDIITDRRERVYNCEYDWDDCFVSSHLDENQLRECSMQLEILRGDGTMPIEAVFDEDGKEVNVRWVHTRYGGAYVGRGVFASSKKALCKKTGWTIKTINVPCWTKFCSSETGMAGVMSGSTQIVRWHTNMVTGEYVGYPE